MGGKYFINAKNYDDFGWKISAYTNSKIKFIATIIKSLFKYQLIDMGVRK